MNTTSLSEDARLAVTREYPLGERRSDAALSEACRLATLLCHRPMAAVELVLRDEAVVAASAGLRVGRIPRADALSSRLLNETSIVVVPDASVDPRFADSKLVHSTPGIRFYAGVPLAAPEGAVLGALSVWDHEPGELATSQAESLEALGRMVMTQLNLWRRQRELERLEAEHARVEATLRETEAKFRGIFENTVVGIYQTSADGHYLSANPMLARIYGYASPEELMAAVGDIQRQLYVDPTARDRFIAALQEQDTITNFEAQIRRKDGSIIWISENARVVRDQRGRVRYYEGTVQDITARRLAEDQLRTSEMLYHSLVEELPQNIFRKDSSERFIFANSRFCQTVERPLEQILGRTDFDLFPPELARKYQADDQRVMTEGLTIRETERNVTPDGAVHWVDVIKTPLRDVSGKIVGIQGIFWDVTERKRLQDALAYERDLLQALLDHSPDIIYFKDPQSRFVKVGRALARRFHVADPEELVGKNSFDLLTPDLAEAVHAEERELLRTGEPIVNKVEQLVDHQGRRSWVSVTKVPIYTRAGATLGLVGVARDITQLIETEQALREAEEKYRTIFENSVEGIFQTSLEGRFIRVNPALARIYGYASPEELMSQVTDISRQVYVDPKRREEFVRTVMEKGSITGFESEIYRRDGSTIWISESARIVRDREGRLAYFEGTIEDISGRKQVEAERESARKAAIESAHMKSEFVATVSHEIRTPLNAIVPNTERLLQTHLAPEQRYLVESIDHGAKMLLQIVNDILDLSKIEAGAVTFENIDFDLHDVVERTVSFFASHAHAKGLDIIGHIHPGVPSRLRGDPARLGQILSNLVGNAIKFTERGEVALEVEAAETNATSVSLRFKVRDTGIGIPPEARHRIFQAFAQADGSMSRRYGGTGLGLAITRGFLELMGGTIDFTSEVGQGTTFQIDLPLARAQESEPAPPLEQILEDKRILVLDASASRRAVLHQSLREMGAAEIADAVTPSDAVRELHAAVRAERPFDVVFFDGDLREGNVLQTARRLRSTGDGNARLIVLTAAGTAADVRGWEAAGICGTIAKPLRQSRFPAELAALLRGERTESAESTPETAESQPGKGLTVLVVEDQPLNQRVAQELLERLGARVDAVSSGPEAISAATARRYDLILMDCQMPGMDGYEATQRIREAERYLHGDDPADPVPIVALSANALADDRERGFRAGMDDYLTKPLLQPELIRILRSVARRNGPVTPAPAQPTPPPEPAELPVLDPGPLKVLAVPGEPEVLAGFVAQFLSDSPARIQRMRAAFNAGDAATVRSEAHALKGSASYMGTSRLVDACRKLETAAQTGQLDAAGELLNTLEAEFDAARKALAAFASPADAITSGDPSE